MLFGLEVVKVNMPVLTFFLLTLLSILAEDVNKTTQKLNISAQKQTESEKTTINITEASLTTLMTTVGSTIEVTTIEPLNTTLIGTCESNDTECIGLNVTTISPSKNDTNTNGTAKETNKLNSKIETDTNICTCNLQVDFCDINCCCDPDCSTTDKTVFGYCEMDENIFYDTRYCNYIKYIYVNNTPLKWEVNQDGLFCIVDSNVPESYLLQTEEPIHSIDTVPLEKKFWGQQQENIWESNQFIFGSKNYGFGDSIVTIRDDASFDNFRLPKSFLTSTCIFEEDIFYLNDVKDTCSQVSVADDNAKLNFSSFFKNFKIIGSPKLFNGTKLKNNIFKNCPKNICIEIEPKLCDNYFTNCTDIETNSTSTTFSCSYDLKKNLNTCQHAVQKIYYKVYHNGTNGIEKVEVLGVLKNFSYHFGREDFEISQDFAVEFLWINQIKNYSQILSGNPGYVTGKPILMGTKITNGSASFIKRNSPNFLDNFLIFPADVDSVCVRNDTHHTAVEFEYNMIAKCRVRRKITNENKTNASTICRNIQEEFFGLWGFKNSRNKSLVVGLFGNANSSKLQDWASILYKTDPKTFLDNIQGNFTNRNTTLLCQNISTLLDVDVFYSRVDLKTILNQNKVLGVSFSFENVRNYSFALSKKNNSSSLDLALGLVSQVSFYDVTGEKTRKNVDPPSFDIRLPYDFFYPFIRVGNGGSSVVPNIIIFAIFLYWNFLLY